jgi:hypothetical protein
MIQFPEPAHSKSIGPGRRRRPGGRGRLRLSVDGVVLATSMHPGQMWLIAFKCPTSGSFSEPPLETQRQRGGLNFPTGIYRLGETVTLPEFANICGHRSDARAPRTQPIRLSRRGRLAEPG